METKECFKCAEIKPVSEFHKKTASKDGYTPRCGQCLRAKAAKRRIELPDSVRTYNLGKRFNMSVDEYNVIFLKQRGQCSICSKPETSKDKKGEVKWLSVDHNHDTGQIRGLLCNACNQGLGKLCDSIPILEKAIEYLKERGSYGK